MDEIESMYLVIKRAREQNIDPVQAMAIGIVRTSKAIALATRNSQNSSAENRAWIIDQMVRILAGGTYEEIIRPIEAGETPGVAAYLWDVGVEPKDRSE